MIHPSPPTPLPQRGEGRTQGLSATSHSFPSPLAGEGLGVRGCTTHDGEFSGSRIRKNSDAATKVHRNSHEFRYKRRRVKRRT